MKKVLIAISRQFGSGGRLIGEKLAGDLGILFCDRSLIQMTAEKSGLAPEFIEKNEESVPSGFLLNLSAASFPTFKENLAYDQPINDKTFFAQSSVIKELAARESCVFVGRCADYILREDPDLVRIFICAPKDQRRQRAVEKYDIPENEIDSKLKKIDKARSNYYKYYTGELWGNPMNNDLIINTGYTGVDGAVETIKAMLKAKGILD